MDDQRPDDLVPALRGYLQRYATFPRSRRPPGWRRRRQVMLTSGLAAIVLAGALITSITVGHARRDQGASAGQGAPSQAAISRTPDASPIASPPADLVPWSPLPPTSGDPTPLVPTPMPTPLFPGIAPCRATQLEGTAEPVGRVGTATFQPVALRNRGAAPCTLNGYPDIQMLDASGRILAEGVGSLNRGTYFDFASGEGVPVVASTVLMLAGTGPLTPATMASSLIGQAYMYIEWYDCTRPQATRLALDLPDSGGRLVIDYARNGVANYRCDQGVFDAVVFRGPIRATGSTDSQAPFIPMTMTISSPATVKRGTTLVYAVVMTNTGTIPYQLTPCPNYYEFLGAKLAGVRYQLNCDPVGVVAPGATVSFEMRLTIPPSFPVGITRLSWTLIDARVLALSTQADVRVTG